MTRPEAMRLCQQMHGDWSGEQIRSYLAGHGIVVNVKTVRMWANPEQSERHREHNKQYKRERALLKRMQALSDAGVTSAGIAAVLSVDRGLIVSEDTVARTLRDGRVGHTLRRQLRQEVAR